MNARLANFGALIRELNIICFLSHLTHFLSNVGAHLPEWGSSLLF